jgi:predicted  nucleic acid-binding Zn-ribbon protein
MDKLLKHALDSNAIGFAERFKDKMKSVFADAHDKLSKKVAADLTGTKIQEKSDEDEMKDLEKKIEDSDDEDEIKELKAKLKVMKKKMNESSTDDAKKTLTAIIGFLKKNQNGKDAKEMLKMANGMKDHVDKKGSFSPDQAKWIFNTSKALF